MPKLFTIFLVMVNLITFCQLKAPEGIGPFKVGVSSIAIIDSLKAELEIPYIGQFTSSEIKLFDFYNKPSMGELVLDTVDLNSNDNPNLLSGGKVRVFLLSQYQIAGINLINLYLTFYRDTLIRIESDKSSTEWSVKKAFELKYGPGLNTVKNEPTQCNQHGQIKMSTDSIEKWSSKGVVTQCYESYRYTVDCAYSELILFYICERDLYSNLLALHEKVLTKLKKAKELQDKRKLSDF